MLKHIDVYRHVCLHGTCICIAFDRIFILWPFLPADSPLEVECFCSPKSSGRILKLIKSQHINYKSFVEFFNFFSAENEHFLLFVLEGLFSINPYIIFWIFFFFLCLVFKNIANLF